MKTLGVEHLSRKYGLFEKQQNNKVLFLRTIPDSRRKDFATEKNEKRDEKNVFFKEPGTPMLLKVQHRMMFVVLCEPARRLPRLPVFTGSLMLV